MLSVAFRLDFYVHFSILFGYLGYFIEIEMNLIFDCAFRFYLDTPWGTCPYRFYTLFFHKRACHVDLFDILGVYLCMPFFYHILEPWHPPDMETWGPHLLWRTSGQSVFRYIPECAQFGGVSVGICFFAYNHRLHNAHATTRTACLYLYMWHILTMLCSCANNTRYLVVCSVYHENAIWAGRPGGSSG